MQIVTSWMEEGIEKGLEQGLKKGRQEGRRESRQEGRREGEMALVVRQLRRRLGPLPGTVPQRISTLSVAQLERLGEALLDFGSVADLEAWLTKRKK